MVFYCKSSSDGYLNWDHIFVADVNYFEFCLVHNACSISLFHELVLYVCLSYFDPHIVYIYDCVG